MGQHILFYLNNTFKILFFIRTADKNINFSLSITQINFEEATKIYAVILHKTLHGVGALCSVGLLKYDLSFWIGGTSIIK